MSRLAPTDLATLTSPDWLGEALGARVESVALVSRGRSLASKARIRVAYADPGCALPAELFLKGFFSAEDSGYAWVGEPEALFFRDIAPFVTARIPHCYYAAVDPANRHGLLILEDLESQGCRFFTPLDVTGVGGVAAALGQFARLHASTWNGTRIPPHALLEPTLERFTTYVTVERLQEMLEGPRGNALPDPIRCGARIYAAIGALLDRLGDGRPRCLIHGDAHLGNTYATPTDERGLLDWQIVQRGSWAWDVAYHVASALPVDERRRSERTLLAHYLEELERLGVAAPPWGEAWTSYRESLAYGFDLWAITQRIAEPIIVEYVTRLGTAVADHETFERLGV